MPHQERHALLSVYDKTGITDFAAELVKLGFTIWSSGGTAKTLSEAGVPVTDVADMVGGQAILGHRVVTLARELHAGLMARDIPEDHAELKRIKAPFIDLVCVDLYPLEAEIAKPGATLHDVTEKTDVGGPTMIRSAAKGRRIVISNFRQRQKVLEWLKAGEPDAAAYREHLAAAAESTIANYTLASARYISHGDEDGLIGFKTLTAKYGENAWQKPAGLYSAGTNDPLALDQFQVVAGAAPSFNNLAELSRQLQTITHIAAGFEQNFGKVPHIAIGTKHGNPCGAAVGSDPTEVIQKMVMGDPRAIFGGLVIVNFEITEELAQVLLTYGMDGGARRLLDAVTAPAFAPEAITLLSRKGDKCRFLANPALADLGTKSLDTAPLFRPVRGGFLRQPNYTYVPELKSKGVTKTGALTPEQERDLVLAWAVCATSNSNTITLAKHGQLIGNGVGQQDRVSCCELAIKRAIDAGHSIKGAAAAGDSFFPFPDGPEVLIQAGVTAIWSTTGSVRDADTQNLCASRGVTLYQAPDAVARGFYGH